MPKALGYKVNHPANKSGGVKQAKRPTNKLQKKRGKR